MFSNNLLMAAAGGGVELVEVGNSAMFDSANSEYLSWTPSSAASSVRIGTLSMWVYKAVQGADQQILQQDWTASGANAMSLHFGTSDGLYFSMENNAQNQIIYRANSSMKFRDIGWYHIHIAYNTNLSVEATACVMTVNGVVLDSWDSTTYSNGGVDSGWPNTGKPIGIGVFIGSDQFLGYLDMYLSEFYFQDGVFGAATDAGEFSDDGLYWTPKDDIQDLSFGTNGFYLDFSDSTHLGEIVGATTRTEILTGTTEANYNDSGGHAATKDKNRGHTRSGGLTNSSTNNDILTPGRDFGEATSITGIRAFAPSDNGFEEGGGSGTATLYGSDTANNDADKSERGSVAYTGANSEVIVIDDATGTYDHWWVEFEAGGSNKSTNVAELEFYTGAGTISAEYFVEINTVTQSAHTPTNSFCLFNPLDIGSNNGSGAVSVDEGNKVFNGNVNYYSNARCTLPIPTSGLWYWEMVQLHTQGQFGIAEATWNVHANAPPSGEATGYVYGANGEKYNNGSGSAYGDTFTTNDVMGVAYNANTGTIWFSKNDTWQNSATIAEIAAGTTTNAAFTGISGQFFPLVMGNSDGDQWRCRFDSSEYTGTIPTDFLELNTTNIAEATTRTVSDPYEHWNNFLYTGTGSSNSLTGVGFQPDFAIIKRRDGLATSFYWYDVVRGAGAGNAVYSSANVAEGTYAEYGVMSSFDNDGITVTTGTTDDNGTNNTSSTYVTWLAKLGGAAASNEDGSITSSVSANTTLRMSCGTYTGTGSAATIGHGLGATPGMVLIKDRDVATYDWQVYHSGVGNTASLGLNTTDAKSTDTSYWNDTDPTSSVFTVGTSVALNKVSTNYVFYAFAPSEFISFGSYEGNGNADGAFVPTLNSAGVPIQPIWYMLKNIDAAYNWPISDVARTTYNVQAASHLFANTTAVEATTVYADILSSGLKMRQTSSNANNQYTYVYMAIGTPAIDKAGRILTAR